MSNIVIAVISIALFIFGMLNWIFTWYEPSRHGTVEQIGREMLDLVSNGLRRTKPGT